MLRIVISGKLWYWYVVLNLPVLLVNLWNELLKTLPCDVMKERNDYKILVGKCGGDQYVVVRTSCILGCMSGVACEGKQQIQASNRFL
jgi:hypothetical protein